MSERRLTVLFFEPHEEEFIGTPFEIAIEFDRRVLIYGTASYRLVPGNMSYLRLVEDNDES